MENQFEKGLLVLNKTVFLGLVEWDFGCERKKVKSGVIFYFSVKSHCSRWREAFSNEGRGRCGTMWKERKRFFVPLSLGSLAHSFMASLIHARTHGVIC